jgi:hypothetical protein
MRWAHWLMIAVLGVALAGAERASAYPRGPRVYLKNDGMTCSGSLIQLGDAPDRVRKLCGSPTSVRNVVYAQRTGEIILEVWRYQRTGWLDRELRFQNGELVSVYAIGPTRPH